MKPVETTNFVISLENNILGPKNFSNSSLYFLKSGNVFNNKLAAVKPHITPPPDHGFVRPTASPHIAIFCFDLEAKPCGTNPE